MARQQVLMLRDSSIGIAHGDSRCMPATLYGIAFAGGNNTVADNNAQYGGNDLTGLLAVLPSNGAASTVNATISSITGLAPTRDEAAGMPNGRSGIWVLGNAVTGQGSG